MTTGLSVRPPPDGATADWTYEQRYGNTNASTDPFSEQANPSNWYSFNTTRWGTKWPANNQQRRWLDPKTLEYTFYTAWSPPVAWFNKVMVSEGKRVPNSPARGHLEALTNKAALATVGKKVSGVLLYAEPGHCFSGIVEYKRGNQLRDDEGDFAEFWGLKEVDDDGLYIEHQDVDWRTQEPLVPVRMYIPRLDHAQKKTKDNKSWDLAAALKEARQRLAFAKTLHARLAIDSIVSILPTAADGRGDLHEMIMSATETVSLEERSNELKNRANAAFKKGMLEEAKRLYTLAIEIDSKNVVLFSNRSATFSKAKRFGAALRDAQHCIRLRRRFLKGYLRAGKALESLGRADDAKVTYMQGLIASRKVIRKSTNRLGFGPGEPPVGQMELMQHLDRLGVSRQEQLVTGCSIAELRNLKKELTDAMKAVTGTSLEDRLKQRQISNILAHADKTLALMQAKEERSGEAVANESVV